MVDEVLAVGDAEFQKKCLGKMREVARGGRTVLFVSHNVPAIQNLCTRCIYLRHGQVAADAATAEALLAYQNDGFRSLGGSVDLTCHPGRTPASVPTMRWARVINGASGQVEPVPMGGTARIAIDFHCDHALNDITFGLVVKNEYHQPVFGVNNLVTPSPALDSPVRAGRVTCILERLPLMPGSFSIDLYFGSRGLNFDVITDAVELTVEPRDVYNTGHLPPSGCGNVWWPASWEVNVDE